MYVNENMDNSEDEVLEMKTVPEVKLNKEREKPYAREIDRRIK